MSKDKWLDGKIIEYKEGACEMCGGRNAFTDSKRCTNCWEVERRLGSYLRGGGERALALVKLALEAEQREAVRQRLIAAIEGEQLKDDLDNESDHAYRAAIRASVKAVRDVDLRDGEDWETVTLRDLDPSKELWTLAEVKDALIKRSDKPR